MSEPESIVFVVDDDPSVRSAIKRLIGSMGLQVELFGAAQEFLASKLPNVPSCLVLDIRLPGISGLSLQRQLAKANIHIPIIFITAHGDIPMTVRAMKAGAVEFLTKPFDGPALLLRQVGRQVVGRLPLVARLAVVAQVRPGGRPRRVRGSVVGLRRHRLGEPVARPRWLCHCYRPISHG